MTVAHSSLQCCFFAVCWLSLVQSSLKIPLKHFSQVRLDFQTGPNVGQALDVAHMASNVTLDACKDTWATQ